MSQALSQLNTNLQQRLSEKAPGNQILKHSFVQTKYIRTTFLLSRVFLIIYPHTAINTHDKKNKALRIHKNLPESLPTRTVDSNCSTDCKTLAKATNSSLSRRRKQKHEGHKTLTPDYLQQSPKFKRYIIIHQVRHSVNVFTDGLQNFFFPIWLLFYALHNQSPRAV